MFANHSGLGQEKDSKARKTNLLETSNICHDETGTIDVIRIE